MEGAGAGEDIVVVVMMMAAMELLGVDGAEKLDGGVEVGDFTVD